VWLTGPAVTIEPPDTLVIVRDQWRLGQTAMLTNQPQIWETTRHGWLTGITVSNAKRKHGRGSEPGSRIVATTTRVPDIAPDLK
jgi:hypothetical protein